MADVAAAPPSVPGLDGLRRVAVVPAFNESASIGNVIDEIRAFDPGFEIVVIDDGSHDHTSAAARAKGAHVLTLPYNLGIGGAVQAGFLFAYQQGFELAVRCDGDGQHDPAQLPAVIAPVLAGEVDVCIGSRFVGEGGYRSSRARRVGIRVLAWSVSRIVGRTVTDTTSGFQALNRDAIRLFAADYPHDYPEVEATVMLHKHGLRSSEVHVTMRERQAGVSSITTLRSIYYMVKVLLSIAVAVFRRNAVPLP